MIDFLIITLFYNTVLVLVHRMTDNDNKDGNEYRSCHGLFYILCTKIIQLTYVVTAWWSTCCISETTLTNYN
jgi:hypothetical protein